MNMRHADRLVPKMIECCKVLVYATMFISSFILYLFSLKIWVQFSIALYILIVNIEGVNDVRLFVFLSCFDVTKTWYLDRSVQTYLPLRKVITNLKIHCSIIWMAQPHLINSDWSLKPWNLIPWNWIDAHMASLPVDLEKKSLELRFWNIFFSPEWP